MPPRSAHDLIVARNLAAALSSGAWTRAALERGAEQVLGRRSLRALRSLVADLLAQTVTPYAPPPTRLVELILASTAFERAAGAAARRAQGVQRVLTPARFSPLPPLRDAPFPRLLSPPDLAAWLEVSLAHLEWFADEKRQHAAAAEPALQHYGYAWLPKRRGPPRLIEAPKSRLKGLQRRILHGILDHLPAHDCAHGFVKGRSCLSAAQRHAGESLVVTADLKDFFLNTAPSRVHGLFRCLGYPWPVARLLTGLCTTATPAGVFGRPPERLDWALRQRYRVAHLPQGAPTSPALANFCAWRLDCRLSGLAAHLNAGYTRYADDLAFSGDRELARRTKPFLAAVAAIARAEGFALNPGKTRIMARAACQRITGLVVNDHLNIPRAEYDALKATLHNCRRHGPASQNRDGHGDFRSHLDGRVTWVENVNPRRGLRLRLMFEAIAWPDGA